MSAELKNTVIAKNSKGSISLSNDLIEHVITELVKNSSNYIVKSVKNFYIDEYAQQCFSIELSFDKQVSFYEDEINSYHEHLKKLIASSLNIPNFNLILIFN